MEKSVSKLPSVILALDNPDAKAAKLLLGKLAGLPFMVKVGLELFASGDGVELAADLAADGVPVFADWKLHDIPTTVARATARIAAAKATYLSVHADPGSLRAANESRGATGILAVTLLTSIGSEELKSAGIDQEPAALVIARARLASELGCKGIVCSPAEVAAVRSEVGAGLVIVTPGISSGRQARHDHARSGGIAAALGAGADHVVVGRAVRDAPDPRAALEGLLAEAGG